MCEEVAKVKTDARYNGKLFSVLGDSISTLSGYSEPDGAAFYEGTRKFKAGVFTPEDTWWGQVIERLGGELLVNNSISGSMVCRHKGILVPSYGCSDERTSALSRDSRAPDVIIVYLGTNDWGAGIKVTPYSKADEGDTSIFSVAYAAMLEKLRTNYPQAEIICCTLSVSRWTGHDEFVFPYRYCGRHIEEYCEAIRTCASAAGCRLVDLYRSESHYDTIDGFHPNADGMKTLADSFIARL